MRAFRHRNYRLFFGGQAISLVGTWMQQIAQAWLVLELTHDPIWLGIVAAAQFIPVMVLGLFAGVAADALPKRRVLLWTQVAMMALAAILAVLVIGGVVQVWMILLLAFLLGIANAVDMPVRQAFAIELVGREDVSAAVALNSAMFNGARVIGPAAAGLAIAAFGVGPAFAINAVSFLAVIVGLRMMDERELQLGDPDRPTRVGPCGRAQPARGARLRATDADRAARRPGGRRRGHGRHELRRPDPGLRPGRTRQRGGRLRVPDGGVRDRFARWRPCGWCSVGGRGPSGWRRAR